MPCFADQVSFTDLPIFYNYFNEYYVSLLDQHTAYHNVVQAYQSGIVDNQTDKGLFACDELYSVVINRSNVTLGFDSPLSDGSFLIYEFNADYSSLELNIDDVTYSQEGSDVTYWLEIAVYSQSGISATMDIRLGSTTWMFVYTGSYVSSQYVFDFDYVSIYDNGQVVTTFTASELDAYSTNVLSCFTTKDFTQAENASCAIISTFMESSNPNYSWLITTYYPNAFAVGLATGLTAEGFPSWSEGYNSGYSDGYNIGHDAGFSEGYESGFADGYESGVSEAPDVDQNAAFENGYQAALNDIESGDFGRNLLGGFLSAPLEALQSFTLVNWETANGDVISISVGTILSAIVGLGLLSWFLKLFAGVNMAFTFDAILSFIQLLLNGFGSIWNLLSWTVGDVIDTLFGWIPLIGDDIADIINSLYSKIVINNVSLENISLFVIMFGYGLIFYLVYQFAVWFLNLIP